MKSVYCDANFYIYSFDVYSPFYLKVAAISRKFSEGGHQVVFSPFLVGELLVLPTRRADIFSIARIRQFFTGPGLRLMEFDSQDVPAFVESRVKGVDGLDALHLAVAAKAKVDFFITNDHKLCKMTVPGIGRIIGLDEAVALL